MSDTYTTPASEAPEPGTFMPEVNTGADHFYLAQIHLACAKAALVDASDPAESNVQFDKHIRMAQVNAQLATARTAATQMLLDLNVHNRYGHITSDVLRHEVDKWSARLTESTPRPGAAHDELKATGC